MIDFVGFYFEYPTEKSRNINQSQNPHIWQCQNLTRLPNRLPLKAQLFTPPLHSISTIPLLQILTVGNLYNQ